MHFVITANSPGEVSTWLTPTAQALKQRAPHATISVYIVPCAFAAGTETGVVRALPDVDYVYSPRDYWRVALGGRPPALTVDAVADERREEGAPATSGALLYLGGDLMHAVRLARRLRLPALAYVERGSRWTKSFQQLLVPDERAQQRVLGRGESPERVLVVGDLMLDAVRPTYGRDESLQRFGLDPDEPVVAVFPGSRPYEIEFSLPFLLRAMEDVRADLPGLQCIISLSAFAAPSVLHGRSAAALDGTTLHVEPRQSGWRVRTGGGLTAVAVQGLPYDVMQVADLALTLPGSNTAEMAAAGLPMVVTLPLNLAEKIPLPGAAQYIEKVPIWGKRWKRALVRQRAGQMDFVAWPNRKAGTAVVPEVRGTLRPADVAGAVYELLTDEQRRGRMRGALQDVMGPPGAAGRVAERLLAVAGLASAQPSVGEEGGAGGSRTGAQARSLDGGGGLT